jgi:Tfp pilus assembly protein PilF
MRKVDLKRYWWSGPPTAPPPGCSIKTFAIHNIMKNIDSKNRHLLGTSAVEHGKDCVSRGELGQAKKWFRKAMQVSPSAEAYTYYAWMLSFEGKFDKAIELCKRAIELDGELGNPYNDIGAYLMSQGENEEAIGWFEKAKLAKRYDPRHFPYTNLGRIYIRKGWLKKAREEFLQAKKWSPESEEIPLILEALEKGLN